MQNDRIDHLQQINKNHFVILQISFQGCWKEKRYKNFTFKHSPFSAQLGARKGT